MSGKSLLAILVTVLCYAQGYAQPLHQKIDRLLAGSSATVQRQASDYQFVRRAYLDFAGVIPARDQVVAFVADKSINKRGRLIDDLLDSPRFARHMAQRFDLLLMLRRPDQERSKVKLVQWRNYLYESFRQNKSWKELAQEILSSTGERAATVGAIRFYLSRQGNLERLTRDVSSAMLGRDLQCAQCHDHPTIGDYAQSHFYGLAAFYTRTSVGSIGGKTVIMEQATGDTKFNSVLTKESGKTPPRVFAAPPLVEPADVLRLVADYQRLDKRMQDHDKVVQAAKNAMAAATKAAAKKKSKNAQEAVQSAKRKLATAQAAKKKLVEDVKRARFAMYRVPPGSKKRPVPKFSRFEQMGARVTAHESFARNMANRLWAHLFGRGIVEPLDMHHRENPPTHPELLDLLSREFVALKYDVRKFLWQLARTQLYGAASFQITNSQQPAITRPIRKLGPYQLAWSVLAASGRVEAATTTLKTAAKKGSERARLDWDEFYLETKLNEALSKSIEDFVLPFITSMPGEKVRSEYTPSQALFLLNGKPLQDMLSSQPGNLVDQLDKCSSRELVARRLFLQVLSRPPTKRETELVTAQLRTSRSASQRLMIIQDLVWSVLTSSEFRFNR